ncbi:SulP family inorganic anion transporter [Carnimonas bestiolae]|uniref:SulP family inorganic anion transporter n=1 Tax=Carnimonas bestiolae TaxID=3402172 RepID=UPI003EDC4DE7
MHTSTKTAGPLSHTLKRDLPAGMVVFLVAVPLCLGIAMASGAPPLAGLIAGIVGGLVVTSVSGSALSVSGPAAGLVVVVVAAIGNIGFDGLLMATVLAGVMQLIFGYLKLGRIGAFVPSSVIKGMLAGIGLILVINQLPLLAGMEKSAVDQSLSTAIAEQFSSRALLLGLVALVILVLWERRFIKRSPVGKIPGPLLAVVAAVALDKLLPESMLAGLSDIQRISLPIDELGWAGMLQFADQLQAPGFETLLKPGVYTAAITIALIASLESLLSLEAVDKIDPLERHSPPHRELKAQGVGNLVSGLVGGLPITAVIVRSSANVQAGGQTRLSSLVHGALLLASVALCAPLLEVIPLACLAAVLVQTGYKLASPQLFIEQYRHGAKRIVPFVVTLVGVMALDLIQGVLLGIVAALYFLVHTNYRRALSVTQQGNHLLIRFRTDITFLNRDELRSRLDQAASGDVIIIDGRHAHHIDPDIQDDIMAFCHNAPSRGIQVELQNVKGTSATYGPSIGVVAQSHGASPKEDGMSAVAGS